MEFEEVRIPVRNATLGADLYRPGGPGPHPVVVMAHGFGGVRRAGLPRFAERFRENGFLVLLFDYRYFGTSEGEPRQLLSVREQLEDWRAALRFARGLESADPVRIGLWGTSYSGGHVIRVAADDGWVAAVVSQVPFASGIRTALKLPPLSALKMTAAGLADLVRSGLLGGRPIYVPIVGPPGSMAAMALDEAVDGVARLHQGIPWENRVPARVGLDTLTYRPLGHASRVRCPLLLQVAERDPLTPPGPVRAMARRAPEATLRTYPISHFDPYFGEWFEVFVGEQVEFFIRHLAGATTRRP